MGTKTQFISVKLQGFLSLSKFAVVLFGMYSINAVNADEMCGCLEVKMIEPTEFDAVNPFFRIKEWKFEEDCIAQTVTDKMPNSILTTDYRLFNGNRWLYVPEEVFNLFLKFGNFDK